MNRYSHFYFFTLSSFLFSCLFSVEEAKIPPEQALKLHQQQKWEDVKMKSDLISVAEGGLTKTFKQFFVGVLTWISSEVI